MWSCVKSMLKSGAGLLLYNDASRCRRLQRWESAVEIIATMKDGTWSVQILLDKLQGNFFTLTIVLIIIPIPAGLVNDHGLKIELLPTARNSQELIEAATASLQGARTCTIFNPQSWETYSVSCSLRTGQLSRMLCASVRPCRLCIRLNVLRHPYILVYCAYQRWLQNPQV